MCGTWSGLGLQVCGTWSGNHMAEELSAAKPLPQGAPRLTLYAKLLLLHDVKLLIELVQGHKLLLPLMCDLDQFLLQS